LLLGFLLALPNIGYSGGAVFTSQVGFSPTDPKIAVMAVPGGTPVQQSFKVLAVPADAVAYTSQTGDVFYYPGGWVGNNATGDTYLLDFTRANLPTGRYVVESNGLRSYTFAIDPKIYDARRFHPLEFFRIQMSGVGGSWQSLDGTVGGHGPDHLDDSRQANRKDKGGGDRALIEQDYLQLPNGHLDVSGGWFDAGDYNKYMGNTPWAAYLLMLAYSENQDYWSIVDENRNGQSDLLEYVGHALEWMLTMQYADGSVYERVFNGFAAPFDGRPDLETDNQIGSGDDRPLDTDRYADITVKSSYAMALAYRIFGDERYLSMAIKSWDWAYANQGRVKRKLYGSGLYFGDVEIGLTLGAIELYRTTADRKYLNYATEHVQSHLSANDWVSPSSWDYQQSYVLQRYFDLASAEDQARIVNQLRTRWDSGIQSQSRNPYRMNDEWLYGNFGQNENSTASAGDALWVFKKTNDRRYYDYAVNQLSWVFGRNPFGESWLASASVSEYTRIPHWKVTAKHPIEGVVVPGATDRDGNGVPDYSDNGEYFYSEPTINQQAMFVRVMSELYFASGGSGGETPEDQPPMVAISTPSDGADVNGTISIKAVASDTDGVVTVGYRVDSGPMVAMTLLAGDFSQGTWGTDFNTTAVDDGQHQLSIIAADVTGQQSSPYVTINVRNGTIPRIRIDRVEVFLNQKGPSRIQARCNPYVYDGFGRPVTGATVSGSWQGAAKDSFTGTTDTTGKITDYSDFVGYVSGSVFTCIVQNVSAAGSDYDPEANNQTQNSVIVP
jgi:endoglucanase